MQPVTGASDGLLALRAGPNTLGGHVLSDALLVLGAGLLVAAAYVGLGLAAALAVSGLMAIFVALAAERATRSVPVPRDDA